MPPHAVSLFHPGHREPWQRGDRRIVEHLRHRAGCVRDESQQIGLFLAAHASAAAGAVRERAARQHLAETLDQALLLRDVIGQAKAILMERLKVTPKDAFDLLRIASNQLNQKLTLVAATLTETGELVSGNWSHRQLDLQLSPGAAIA